MILKHESDRTKTILFSCIATTIIVASSILIGATVYLNSVASSKGPVHWHADTEVWVCGQELDIQNPTGRLSNKIGTSTLHEHNDKRIHLEGVVVEPRDASLGKFFRVIGGELGSDFLVLPTTGGTRSLVSGQLCGDEEAELQVFVYKVNPDKTYTQTKLIEPASYVISGQPQVPDGDCVIVEFDRPRTRTDHLCLSYKVAQDPKVAKLKGEK